MVKVQLAVLMVFAAEMVLIACVAKAVGWRGRVSRTRRRAHLGLAGRPAGDGYPATRRTAG